MTFEQLLAECARARTQADADQCFAALVDHLAAGFYQPGTPRAEIEPYARETFGYWLGYGPPEERARLEPLYRCEHPVFGSVAECGYPTAEEARAAGRDLAQAQSPVQCALVVAELRAQMKARLRP